MSDAKKRPTSIPEAVMWIRADCDHKRQSCEEVGCHTGIALHYLEDEIARLQAIIANRGGRA